MKTKTSGFTLIELLVAIVIVGILASISTTTFQGYLKKARDTELISTLNVMKLSILNDGASTGQYLYADENNGIAVRNIVAPQVDFDQLKYFPNCFVFGYKTSSNDSFFLSVELEAGGLYTIGSSKAAVDAVTTDYTGIDCSAGTKDLVLEKTAVKTNVAGYIEFPVAK